MNVIEEIIRNADKKDLYWCLEKWFETHRVLSVENYAMFKEIVLHFKKITARAKGLKGGKKHGK